MIKKINYNYLKPQNYYNRLFTFFFIAAFMLTLTLVGFSISDFEDFLLKLVVILFLLMLIAVLIEYKNRSEYMSPLEVYDVENYYKRFYLSIRDGKNMDLFFHKYNIKTKRKLDPFIRKRSNFVLSNIRKENEVYEITVIDINKLAAFHFLKFFIRKAIYRIYVKEFDGSFKIILIN